MILFINTSNSERIFLALINKPRTLKMIGQILDKKNINAHFQQSEKLLSNIEKLLEKNKLNFKKIKGVIVVTGSGGFTGLRIGIATANAIAWSLGIPILGIKNNKNESNQELIQKGLKKILRIKKFKQILPEYGKEPNVTLK